MAEAQAVKVAPHDGSVGPIVEMANVHVMASIPNCFYLEHKATDVGWRYEVAPGSVEEKGGYIAVPDTPGLGLDIDEAVAAAHPIRAVDDFSYGYRTPEEIQQSEVR